MEKADSFETPLEPFFLGAKVSGKMPATADRAVRYLFRWMGGLPHVRDTLSVLAGCPISCAWWRRRAAVESERFGEPFTVEDARRVLQSGSDA